MFSVSCARKRRPASEKWIRWYRGAEHAEARAAPGRRELREQRDARLRERAHVPLKVGVRRLGGLAQVLGRCAARSGPPRRTRRARGASAPLLSSPSAGRPTPCASASRCPRRTQQREVGAVPKGRRTQVVERVLPLGELGAVRTTPPLSEAGTVRACSASAARGGVEPARRARWRRALGLKVGRQKSAQRCARSTRAAAGRRRAELLDEQRAAGNGSRGVPSSTANAESAAAP